MALPFAQILSSGQRSLRDADAGEPICPETETKLVTLHQFTASQSDLLLMSMSGVAHPAEDCTLIIDQHQIATQYGLFGGPHMANVVTVTFNNLLTAPTIRVTCTWPHKYLPDTRTPLSVSLDFHFKEVDKKISGISGITGLQVRHGVVYAGNLVDEVEFSANGATSEGFNNAMRMESSLGDYGRGILHLLKALRRPTEPHQILLRFARPLETSSSAFAALLPYVAGQDVLPSIALPLGEWNTFLPLRPERNIEDLVHSATPFAMVSLNCGNTYASVTQAAVELHESARFAHLEQQLALELWARATHSGMLFKIGGVAVMSVRSGDYSQLGGPHGLVKFDLPDRLDGILSWKCPVTGTTYTEAASRCVLPVRLPAHDVLFVMKLTSDLSVSAIKPSEEDAIYAAAVNFSPREYKYALGTQLATAVNLQHPDSAHWHQLILNQDHEMDRVDLATARSISENDEPSLPIAAIEEAYSRMLQWRTWNDEQLEALESVRNTLGGIALITGPAGCGKSLILQAMCAFFYAIGLHVLVLAPANSNCADLMEKMTKWSPEISATRVFPSSRDFCPDKIARSRKHERVQISDSSEDDTTEPSDSNQSESGQAADRVDGTTTDLLTFEMVRAETNDAKYAGSQVYGLSAQVLRVARDEDRDSKYSLVQGITGRQVDIWEELRKHIEASDAGTFDWGKESDVKAYQQAYDCCKGHYVALQRLLITTTGNVRNGDITNNFARDLHGLKCEGLIIIEDEAGKDFEISTLSALLLPEWRGKITGMVLLGDERQLEPTNTSAKGRTAFNPFASRISIPLLTRLKAEGFPCTELVEQHRMSYHIAYWPSKEFYKGMRDGPGTFGLLTKKQPGLVACLKEILLTVDPGFESRFGQFGDVQQDRFLRAHYLEINGRRDNSKKSAVVREHVKVFFDVVYWPLMAYYGEHMRENVMIIVAYKGARNLYRDAMAFLQRKHSIPDTHTPQILTIDSSQGCEAPVTIIDCSVQRYSDRTRRGDIGFVDDDKRMNVAMTRAQEVRWFLGGSCNAKPNYRGRRNMQDTPAYVRHRDEIMEVTRVGNQLIDVKNEEWMDKLLAKKHMKLERRFRDDVAR